MGNARNSLGAAWREARKKTGDAVSAGVKGAEAAKPEQVRQIKEAGVKAQQKAGGMRRTAAEKRSELTLRLAASSFGSAAGQKLARMGGGVAALPVLSLPADLFNERHGVNVLAQRLKQAPDDAFAHLKLAESLIRMQREMLVLVAARSVATMSPLPLMIREGVRTAGAVSRGDGLPIIDKLLKRAYGLAMARLRKHPSDPESLHAIARVYLAKHNPRGALKPALLGVTGRPQGQSGPVFYTLSRSYQALDDDGNARLSAQAAIDDDFSLGWLILSDLVYGDPALTTTAARRQAYLQALGHVTQKDLVSYAGIRPQAGEVVKSVYALQKSKTITTYSKASESVKQLQGKVVKLSSRARLPMVKRSIPPPEAKAKEEDRSDG
ncbi:hypothetical protein G5C51_34605 [Streptomyces sp. A7024]|uniref:Uncharacterized protein n=1 Tax=Streptomyces coryli TaxID=1128680 RepID=A0A6G4UCE7_9ACTN|nr:hypothetical protein [Streptomyces coryli]NGN69007.1 hypothetical protein [Streptomyces coryli]